MIRLSLPLLWEQGIPAEREGDCWAGKVTELRIAKHYAISTLLVNLSAPELVFLFNFSTLCTQNVNNTGTKYVRIMKQTAF